jgi:phage gp37-like protein
MASQLKVDQVEKALITALKGALASANVQVQGLTAESFDQDGNLVIVPPAVLVLFSSNTYAAGKDHLKLDYQSDKEFQILCGARDPRSENERLGAYDVVNRVLDALAGLKLALDANTKTEPIFPMRVELFQFTVDGTWYSVHVNVGGIAQFTPKA